MKLVAGSSSMLQALTVSTISASPSRRKRTRDCPKVFKAILLYPSHGQFTCFTLISEWKQDRFGALGISELLQRHRPLSVQTAAIR